MNTFFTVVVIVFVVAVLGAVAYAIYEISPWGKHLDHFRNESGDRVGSSPRLD